MRGGFFTYYNGDYRYLRFITCGTLALGWFYWPIWIGSGYLILYGLFCRLESFTMNLITSTTQKTTLNTNTPTVFRVYDRYAEYRENRYSNNQQKQNMYYQDARDEVDVDVDNVDVETRYNRQIARSRSRSPYSPNNTSAYYRSRL